MSGEIIAIIAVGITLAGLILTSFRSLRIEMRSEIGSLPGESGRGTQVAGRTGGRAMIERLSLALLLAVLLLATALPAEGQELPVPETIMRQVELFDLFTECAPVSLGVLVRDDDDEPIGLTADRVRTMVESRLRAARLYAPEISAVTLHLSVVVFRDAFAYNAAIAKRRSDPFTGGTLPTTGFPTGISFPDIGTHGGGATAANFIMQGLTERVDGLIFDYLRVNGEYC